MSNVLTIGTGFSPNDTRGDPLRTSMINIMTAVNGLAGHFNGSIAPSSLLPFQSWFDTSTTPPTLRYYDGLQWVAAGTLNQSTHSFGIVAPSTSTLGGVLASSAGASQFATGVNTSGAVIYAQPSISNLSNIASGTVLGNASGGGAPPSALTTLPSALTYPNAALTGLATLASSTTTAAPSLTITPTANAVTTIVSHNVQTTSGSSTTREFLAAIGFTANTGTAGVYNTSGVDDKVALYIGATCQSGAKACWAVNDNMNLTTPLHAHFFGALTRECDFTNASGNNFHNTYGAVGTLSQFVGNELITGLSTNQVDFAIAIGGYNASTLHGMYNRGIFFSPDPLGAILADIQTESSAATAFADFGKHSIGVALTGTYSAEGVLISPSTSTPSAINIAGTYSVDVIGDASTSPYGVYLSGTYATAALYAGGNIVTTGETLLSASTTARASMNIPQGTAPTTPVNGDVWMTSAGLFYRFASTTHGPL